MRSYRSKKTTILHLRLCNLFRQCLVEPVQFLQCLQPRNSPSILDAVTKERGQDLDLLPREELRRKRFNDSGEVGYRLAAQYRVFVIDILPQGLHDLDQSRLLVLYIFTNC